MRYFLLSLMLLLPAFCFAEKVPVGNETLNLPVIEGYASISRYTEQFGVMKTSDTPPYETVQVLAKPSVVEQVNSGELVDLKNYILTKVFMQLKGQSVAIEQWRVGGKSLANAVNASFVTVNAEEVSKILQQNYKEQQEIDLKIDIQAPTLIEPAVFKDDRVTFSALTKFTVGAGEESEEFLSASKGIMVLIDGKIFLYTIYQDYTGRETFQRIDETAKNLLAELPAYP